MKSRRAFLKGSLLAAAGLAVTGAGRAAASGAGLPSGIIYTARDPGKWAAKVGSHAPVVTVNGRKVTIETRHGMSEKHYIVRHTLVAADGKVLGSKTFYPADEKALSTFELPAGGSKFYATSFCNLHDFWLTEFSV